MSRPPWLLPEDELPADGPKLPPVAFTVAIVSTLLALGCSIAQAIGIAAHLLLESGHGQHYRGDNIGGVKTTKAWAEAERKAGRRAMWWQAPGHVEQGDPETCHYRGYASMHAFLVAFLAAYCRARSGRYAETSRRFAAGGDWFAAMIAAGYRGPKTKANPGPAIATQRQLERTAAARWAQTRLEGLVHDGVWGPKSEAACKAYQREHGLPETGKPDVATLEAMARPVVTLPG